MRYTLTFEGGAATDGEKFPRYRRAHSTLASAEAEAMRVRDELQQRNYGVYGGTTTASHNPQIHHPDGSVSTIPWI